MSRWVASASRGNLPTRSSSSRLTKLHSSLDMSSTSTAVTPPTEPFGSTRPFREGTTTMRPPVILITGALTGIGRATALAFAKEGATVVVSGRREAEGKALENELRGLGAKAAFILADVRHEDDVHNLVE